MARFATLQEEVEYWQKRCEETERDFEEYQQSSQMLEKELEASLEQAEKANRDLRTRNNRLMLENETLKERYEQEHEDLVNQIADLQDESKRCHGREENYVKYIRELEQKNDDLERSQRATYTSLAEFEVKLNSAIERNVLLESELDEKENLKAMVQRLKDETRDLKQEIQVRERELRPEVEKPSLARRCSSFRTSSAGPAPLVDGKRASYDATANTKPPHAHVKSLASHSEPGICITCCLSGGHSVLTTPSRVSAMNIVGDLLRKVGERDLVSQGGAWKETRWSQALESKLASCRLSPIDNTRDSARRRSRLHRGVSSPSIHNMVRS